MVGRRHLSLADLVSAVPIVLGHYEIYIISLHLIVVREKQMTWYL